jgi:hypothetical protein
MNLTFNLRQVVFSLTGMVSQALLSQSAYSVIKVYYVPLNSPLVLVLAFAVCVIVYDELMLQEARSSSFGHISPANFNHTGAVDAQPISKQYVSSIMFGLITFHLYHNTYTYQSLQFPCNYFIENIVLIMLCIK